MANKYALLKLIDKCIGLNGWNYFMAAEICQAKFIERLLGYTANRADFDIEMIFSEKEKATVVLRETPLFLCI